MKTKKCEYCGKEFQPRQFNQKYCSRQCSKKAGHEKEKSKKTKLQIRECIICGEKFQPKTKAQIICDNPECKRKRSIQKSNKFHKNGKNEIIEKECIICGEKFKTSNPMQILCGKEECKKERASREKRGVSESEYPNMIGMYTYGTKEQTRICPVCNKEFITNVSNQIYCSEECQHKRVCLDRPNNLNKPRICPKCGCEFLPTGSNQKYCKKCSVIAKKDRQKKYNDNKPRKDYELIPCMYCGELFKPKMSNQKYCCKEHQELHYEESGYNKRISSEYFQNNKEKIAERNKNRRHNDKEYKMQLWCRQQVKRCVTGRNKHTSEIFDYTSEELIKNLESKFYGDISWNNYGELWDIHHIKRLADFNFVLQDGSIDYEQIRQANGLDNLMPLTKDDHKKLHREEGITQ